MSALFEINSTPTRGKALRLPARSEALEPGTLVVSEEPLIVIECRDEDGIPSMQDIFLAVKSLGAVQKLQYDALAGTPASVQQLDWRTANPKERICREEALVSFSIETPD